MKLYAGAAVNLLDLGKWIVVKVKVDSSYCAGINSAGIVEFETDPVVIRLVYLYVYVQAEVVVIVSLGGKGLEVVGNDRL